MLTQKPPASGFVSFVAIRIVRAVSMLILSVAASAVAEASASGPILTSDRPAAPTWEQDGSEQWYEGALLGNGDLGVVVYGASDRITFGVGKNDMWDRRFFFKNHKPLSYQKYLAMAKSRWPVDPKTGQAIPQADAFPKLGPVPPIKPQPKPVCRVTVQCPENTPGQAPRSLAPVRHHLSLEQAELTTRSTLVTAVARVQKDAHLVLIRFEDLPEGAIVTVHRDADSSNTDIAAPVHSVAGLDGLLTQDLPAEDTYPQGFQCAVAARLESSGEPRLVDGRLTWQDARPGLLILAVATTRDQLTPVPAAQSLLAEAVRDGDASLRQRHVQEWKTFWDASWIRLDDAPIERLWYVHNYLLASAARPGAVAPGLFGPWIVNDTSAWYGGYTTDYNFQQTFAAALSCNHPELLEPYLETLERMLPAARQCARELFEAEGIAYPHQMFPIDMMRQWHAYNCYVCETPWLLQHFWEYYEHTQDKDFLRERAYPMVAAGADFMASYAKPEGDGKYVFDPTSSPEHHHLLPGLPFNRNGTPELGFARYILKAALMGAEILGQAGPRVDRWREVLKGLPPYPRSRNQLGEIFLDCEATPPERNLCAPVPAVADHRPSKQPGNHGPWMTYNCPTSLLQVWPAGQIDMDSPADELLTAMRSWQTAKFEGSNDLIMRHVAGARLGIPTLEQLKLDIAPRLLLNGSITCMMNPLFGPEGADSVNLYRANGVYTETFAFPLVLNEMMLQSQNGVLRFFPTMDYYRKAEFHHLRARGGFLVSAAMDRGCLLRAEIVASVPGTCRIRLPWPRQAVSLKTGGGTDSVDFRIEDDNIAFEAATGTVYRLVPVFQAPEGK